MTGGRLALAVIASIFFPGFGHGLLGRRVRAGAYAIAGLLATILVVASVWFVPVGAGVRLVAAIDAYVCGRRGNGVERWPLAIAALVVGVVGIGVVQISVRPFEIPSSSMYPGLIIGDHVLVERVSIKWRAVERGEVIVFMQPCAKKPFVKRVIGLPGDRIEVRCGVVRVNDNAVAQKLVSANASYIEGDHGSMVRHVSRYRETLDGHTYDVFQDPERAGHEAEPDRHDFPPRDTMLPPSCSVGAFYDTPSTSQPKGTLVETKGADATAAPCSPQVQFVVPPRSLFVMGDNRNNANDSRFWGVVPDGALIGRVVGVYQSSGVEGGLHRFGAVR